MRGNYFKIISVIALLAGISIGIATYMMQSNSMHHLMRPTATLSASELESLFGNPPCSLPCWQGITPGITSSTEVLQSLSDSPVVLDNTIKIVEPRPGAGKADWRWIFGGEQSGNLEWRDGIVRWVSLGIYPSISIGMIINKYGPPEKIDAMNCTEVVEAPPVWCATLYYAKNGFEVHLSWESPENGNALQITPADLISGIMLFEPSTVEELLLSLGIDSQELNIRDWKGYGNLYELYVR